MKKGLSYYYKKKRQRVMKRMIMVTMSVISFLLVGFFFIKSGLHQIVINQISGIDKKEVLSQIDKVKNTLSNEGEEQNNEKNLILKIAVMSDSHGSSLNIQKAMERIGTMSIDLILHLGDFTQGGELEYFDSAHQALSSKEIPFKVIPGDHDFNWFPEYSRENYESVFGESSYNQFFIYHGVGVILFENSLQIEDENDRFVWLNEALNRLSGEVADILFFSARPLYSPYFQTKSDVGGEALLDLLNQYGVEYVFSGDTHIFAEYSDLSESFKMYTVGAIGEYKNLLPGWVLVEVYDDGSADVKAQPLSEF
jgi:predicted phosphodiesterase